VVARAAGASASAVETVDPAKSARTASSGRVKEGSRLEGALGGAVVHLAAAARGVGVELAGALGARAGAICAILFVEVAELLLAAGRGVGVGVCQPCGSVMVDAAAVGVTG